MDRAHVNSCVIQAASSNSGGAPWLRYSAGRAPSPGVQAACGPAWATRARWSTNGCDVGTVMPGSPEVGGAGRGAARAVHGGETPGPPDLLGGGGGGVAGIGGPALAGPGPGNRGPRG